MIVIGSFPIISTVSDQYFDYDEDNERFYNMLTQKLQKQNLENIIISKDYTVRAKDIHAEGKLNIHVDHFEALPMMSLVVEFENDFLDYESYDLFEDYLSNNRSEFENIIKEVNSIKQLFINEFNDTCTVTYLGRTNSNYQFEDMRFDGLNYFVKVSEDTIQTVQCGTIQFKIIDIKDDFMPNI